jgi:hypothetical protein
MGRTPPVRRPWPVSELTGSEKLRPEGFPPAAKPAIRLKSLTGDTACSIIMKARLFGNKQGSATKISWRSYAYESQTRSAR